MEPVHIVWEVPAGTQRKAIPLLYSTIIQYYYYAVLVYSSLYSS